MAGPSSDIHSKKGGIVIDFDIRPLAPNDTITVLPSAGAPFHIDFGESFKASGTLLPSGDNGWRVVSYLPLRVAEDDNAADAHLTGEASLEALDDWARKNPFEI